LPGLTRDNDACAPLVSLHALQLLRVAGADRQAFLQGQLTQDLRLITPTRAVRYAWADAQGRVLVAGEAFDWRDALWLTVPAMLAAGIVRRLRMFVLRAQVTVEVAEVMLAGCIPAAGAALALPGATLPARPLECSATAEWLALRPDAGRLLIAAPAGAWPALLAAQPGTPADADAWTLADIRAGFARIGTATGAYIPQMLNLDLAGALSFDKGCYPGQETVTRTRHLGRLKRRLLRFGAGLPPPAAGDPVFGPAGESGAVVLAAPAATHSELLAVVRLEAAAGPLFADAQLRQPLAPLALPYGIPEMPPA